MTNHGNRQRKTWWLKRILKFHSILKGAQVWNKRQLKINGQLLSGLLGKLCMFAMQQCEQTDYFNSSIIYDLREQ